jgi:hypothetical protein
MFTQLNVDLPENDCDVVIKFPGGKLLTIQARPSNCHENYNGSLDIILPENKLVTSWIGEDMKDAPAPNKKRQNERMTMQLVTELPGDYPW